MKTSLFSFPERVRKYLFFIVLSTVVSTHLSGQILVSEDLNAIQLAEKLMGDDVTIFNVTTNGQPGNLINNQIGLFTGNSALVEYEEALVLASGPAISILPSGGSFAPLTFPLINDPDLVAISGFGMRDVAVLEFDFIPNRDTLEFSFVWGSFEYPSFTCSNFNDAFGIFLSGPGFQGPFSNNAVNLAVIPGTNIPVTINTVNGGSPTGGGSFQNCLNANPNFQNDSQYFINNNPTLPGDVNIPGLTVALPAIALVQQGDVYHLKIAIGDAVDGALDSYVFIKTKSDPAPTDLVVTSSQTKGICTGDGFPDILVLEATTDLGTGLFGVVTIPGGNVVATSATGVFDLENLPGGNYAAGFITVDDLDQLNGITNLSQVQGNYSLSNSIPISTIALAPGTISTNSAQEVCGGTVAVSLSGNAGPVTRYVLLNQPANTVLLSNTTGIFNFNSLAPGLYRLVAVTGSSLAGLGNVVPPVLQPCVVASNVLNIQKLSCGIATLESSPNPASDISFVTFSLPQNETASLEVYDMAGRLVETIYAGSAQADTPYRFEFTGRDLPSGIYVYRLTTGSESLVRKFLLQR